MQKASLHIQTQRETKAARKNKARPRPGFAIKCKYKNNLCY